MAAPAQLLSLTLIIFIISGNFQTYAVTYDQRFTHECLRKPLKPQYGGGIAMNPKLSKGMKGWTQKGDAKVDSKNGNKYIVASVAGNRTSTLQEFHLDKDKLYVFSAWLQVRQGNVYIGAFFKTQTITKTAGWVAAQEGCWSMLKGGLVVNASGPAELYFESVNSTSEIWVDSISLQPFTYEEWNSHQEKSIQKVRKGKVKFQAIDEHGRSISNATISIKQIRPDFPLGCAINNFILEHPAYEKWFTSRFKYTVFENELKWTTTEPYQRGSINYTLPDSLLRFTKSHGLTTRGHTVLWGSRGGNPIWLENVTVSDQTWVRAAVDSRVESVMERYKGQFIHWDIVNENMHHDFLEEILGTNASSVYYQKANEIDRETLPFLNEYFTVEKSQDQKASPWKYLNKIREIRRQGYKGPLGIGLQGHFSELNLPYLRASIDVLSSAKLPIWITELDVANKTWPNQAKYLEQILRELHAHKAVQGIIIWGGWWPNQGCWRMCLTDDNFKNLATGDVVDKIMPEWTYAGGLKATTDTDGHFQTSLFHGQYEAQITHPKLATLDSNLKKFEVFPNGHKAQHIVLNCGKGC